MKIIILDKQNIEWTLNACHATCLKALFSHEIGHNLGDLRYFDHLKASKFDGQPKTRTIAKNQDR